MIRIKKKISFKTIRYLNEITSEIVQQYYWHDHLKLQEVLVQLFATHYLQHRFVLSLTKQSHQF